jgi:hypothetical protein
MPCCRYLQRADSVKEQYKFVHWKVHLCYGSLGGVFTGEFIGTLVSVLLTK